MAQVIGSLTPICEIWIDLPSPCCWRHFRREPVNGRSSSLSPPPLTFPLSFSLSSKYIHFNNKKNLNLFIKLVFTHLSVPNLYNEEYCEAMRMSSVTSVQPAASCLTPERLQAKSCLVAGQRGHINICGYRGGNCAISNGFDNDHNCEIGINIDDIL